jgi:eukaryotic-like serine/threonine-protein kinase
MFDGSELLPGTVLGAYRIVRRIGTGGMGAVYEAEHRELNKRVALKTPYSDAGLSPEGRARFVQEGRTVSRIRHPHVVDITDVGEIDDIAYLVMEYLEGETLAELIKREGPLSARVVADILVPVAGALQEAHGLGIVHRDLKPDNIFLTRSVHGSIHPKVLDFGISKVLGDSMSPRLTNTNTILGTPSYVSPEQLESAHLTTPLSDQYSLGVVIYEAATGQNPFAGYTSLVSMINAVVKGSYRRPLEINPRVEERLSRIALRAMSVSPKARFPSMAALGAELLPLASPDTLSTWTRYLTPSSPTTPLSHGVARSPRASNRRFPWLFAAGGAAFLATVGIALRPPPAETPRGAGIEQTIVEARGARTPAAAGGAPAAAPAERASGAIPAPTVSGVSGSAGSMVRRETPPPSDVAARARAGSAEELSTSRPERANAASKSRRRARESGAGSSAETREVAERREPTRSIESPAVRAEREPAQRPREALQTDNVDPWAP